MITATSQNLQKIEGYIDTLEKRVFNDQQFNQWRGAFEVKKTYIKKENADIKCDLDIRLQHWPAGVVVKIYKHKALAVLPSVTEEDTAVAFLYKDAVPVKFWKNSFYFSHRTDLDDARYVLRDGNDMTPKDADTCLEMLHGFIVDIEEIINKSK